MIPPPLPPNEAERLATLRALRILDTPPEERFDRITRIAARLFDVPIVAVSLVDADRQWFKSCQGLAVRETSREISFCGHTILGEGMLVVPDARLDPRFVENPLVTGEPGIRFYVGHPLAGPDGHPVGTLCLIDRRPRALTDHDQEALRDLAAMVVNELSVTTAIQHALREREAEHAALKYRATHDALTDLPNRILFTDRLEQAIRTARRERMPGALLLMNLDRFKDINNTLGHTGGDLVLQQVGRRLRDLLRECDTVARLSGDEFAVLLPSADTDGAILVVRTILQALEAPCILEGLPLQVEASLGIVVYPDHGEEADSLLRRADVAMHAAKQAGSGYVVYAAERDHYSPRRLALMGELRHAIDQDHLRLLYQPQVHLPTGRVTGVEALVRWQHPQHGLLPPAQFIPAAERTGLIKPLTLWVLKTALQQCQAWHRAGWDLRVAVNLSARNFQDPQLPDQVAALLRQCGVSPNRLEIEITESTLMADPARAMDILTRVSALGVGLSIDDFGTGYSSLGYLKSLPVDAIKVDKSFVMNMAADNNDTVIVRSTIDLAHNLGLTVVAEGVETQDVWDRLVALGCDAVQGYYLSRPMPAVELTDWLRRSPWKADPTPPITNCPSVQAA
jgi:diguanylate cyclase (GGDEF)-like protein